MSQKKTGEKATGKEKKKIKKERNFKRTVGFQIG